MIKNKKAHFIFMHKIKNLKRYKIIHNIQF